MVHGGLSGLDSGSGSGSVLQGGQEGDRGQFNAEAQRTRRKTQRKKLKKEGGKEEMKT